MGGRGEGGACLGGELVDDDYVRRLVLHSFEHRLFAEVLVEEVLLEVVEAVDVSDSRGRAPPLTLCCADGVSTVSTRALPMAGCGTRPVPAISIDLSTTTTTRLFPSESSRDNSRSTVASHTQKLGQWSSQSIGHREHAGSRDHASWQQGACRQQGPCKLAARSMPAARSMQASSKEHASSERGEQRARGACVLGAASRGLSLGSCPPSCLLFPVFGGPMSSRPLRTRSARAGEWSSWRASPGFAYGEHDQGTREGADEGVRKQGGEGKEAPVALRLRHCACGAQREVSPLELERLWIRGCGLGLFTSLSLSASPCYTLESLTWKLSSFELQSMGSTPPCIVPVERRQREERRWIRGREAEKRPS